MPSTITGSPCKLEKIHLWWSSSISYWKSPTLNWNNLLIEKQIPHKEWKKNIDIPENYWNYWNGWIFSCEKKLLHQTNFTNQTLFFPLIFTRGDNNCGGHCISFFFDRDSLVGASGCRKDTIISFEEWPSKKHLCHDTTNWPDVNCRTCETTKGNWFNELK